MRPLRLILVFCGLTGAAMAFSAGGATGVVPVTDASPSKAAAGAHPPAPAPSLLDRTIRVTLRMAMQGQDSAAPQDAAKAPQKFENSFRAKDPATRVRISRTEALTAVIATAGAPLALSIRPKPREARAFR